MANIKVNVAELGQLLDKMPAKQNLMLVGNHGIGKSEILTEYYSCKGMPVIALFLGQMSDPGDIIGLPNKNEKSGKTEFMPPYWFPLDGKPVVLFLDELNRARPEVLQTIMDLALNRKLAGRPLPEGSRIISAVNEGEQYQLTDLDPALVSRFNVVEFAPSVQEWLLWAKKKNIDSRVIDFIQGDPIWLDRNPDSRQGEDTGLEKTPDRRGWEKVSDVISGQQDLSGIYSKVISSIVGVKAASKFINSMSTQKIIAGKDVLYNYSGVKPILETYQLHELSIVNDSIFRCLEVEKITSQKKEAIGNLEAYFDFLAKSKKEAAAHFANLYVQQSYPNAVTFIATECRLLTMSLIVYVKGIK